MPILDRIKARRELLRYAKKADQYKNDPQKAQLLVTEAFSKATKVDKEKGPLVGVFKDLMTLMQLVKAYFRGEYREIPWESLAWALAAVIYFVSPLDLIPDILPGGGFIDDAFIIGLVINSLKVDLANFRQWQNDRLL